MHESVYIGETSEQAVKFAANELIQLGQQAIDKKGLYTLALSGGSTPKAIYKELSKNHQKSLDWSKVLIFFSDERCVPPSSEESNYKMALESGIGSLGIPPSQIFRIVGEEDPKNSALAYENLIKQHVPGQLFDLIMLGLGNDGHTASLFPNTEGLKNNKDLVISNWVPSLNASRITFTFKLINQARHIHVHILGSSKASIVREIFSEEKKYPIQRLDYAKTLFILDDASTVFL
jgi:6-phosphogluconolactonase